MSTLVGKKETKTYYKENNYCIKVPCSFLQKKKNHVLVQQEPVVGYEENKDRSDTCTTLTWVALMVSHAEAALLRRAQGLNL